MIGSSSAFFAAALAMLLARRMFQGTGLGARLPGWPTPVQVGFVWLPVLAVLCLAVLIGLSQAEEPVWWAAKPPGLWWLHAIVGWVDGAIPLQIFAGLLAGLVVGRALDALTAAPPGQGTVNAAVLATSPALVLLVLYFISNPAMRQSFGLKGFEFSGVKIDFDQRSQAVQREGSEQIRNTGTAFEKEKSDNYFPILVDITTPTIAEDAKNAKKLFSDRQFFDREARFVKLVDGFDPSSDKLVRGRSEFAIAFRAQQELVESLHPVVECAQLFRNTFKGLYALTPVVEPVVDTLVALNAQLMAVQNAGTSQISRRDMREKDFRSPLGKAYRALISASDKARSELDQKLEGAGVKVRPGCARADPVPTAKEPFPTERLGVAYHMPSLAPYVPIVLAWSHAGLGAHNAAFKVLEEWIKSYEKMLNEAPEQERANLPKWPLIRVAFEMAALQDSFGRSAPSQQRNMTRWVMAVVEDHLSIKLPERMNGCKRDSGRAQSLAASLALTEPEAADHTIFASYLSGIETYLNAVVDSRSQKYLVDRAQVDLANFMLDFQASCLRSLKPDAAEQQWALNRLAAGRILARWRIDGPRAGIRDVASLTVKDKARAALQDAADFFRRKEREGDVFPPKGRRDFQPNLWERYRSLAERELLDLDQDSAL